MNNSPKIVQSTALSATSSLVLLWAKRDCYKSLQARKFMAMLNLEAGVTLLEQCNAIWPNYNQVILNRKFAVALFASQCLQKNINLTQVVILGAGLAPLSIELAVSHPHLRLFDVDVEQMPLKRRLLGLLNDKRLSAIRCITADLKDDISIQDQLLAASWKPDEPTMVILEGISYYLTAQELLRSINLFRNRQNRTRVILEYLVPDDMVASEHRGVPQQVFQLIATACGLSSVTRLKHTDISSWENSTLLQRQTMHSLEKIRTGNNTYFPTEDSGWIEVCLLAI